MSESSLAKSAPILCCSGSEGTGIDSDRKSLATRSCIIVDAFVDLTSALRINLSLFMAYFQYHKSYDVFGLNTIKIWETIPSPMTFSTNLPCENSLFEWPSKAISPTRITLYVRRYSRSETTASGLNLIAATEMILSVSKLKSFFSQTGLYNSPSLRCSQAVVNPPPGIFMLEFCINPTGAC